MGAIDIFGGGLWGAGWTGGGTSGNTYTTSDASLNTILGTSPYYNAVRQAKAPTLPLSVAPKPLSFYDKLRKEIDEWIKL